MELDQKQRSWDMNWHRGCRQRTSLTHHSASPSSSFLHRNAFNPCISSNKSFLPPSPSHQHSYKRGKNLRIYKDGSQCGLWSEGSFLKPQIYAASFWIFWISLQCKKKKKSGVGGAVVLGSLRPGLYHSLNIHYYLILCCQHTFSDEQPALIPDAQVYWGLLGCALFTSGLHPYHHRRCPSHPTPWHAAEPVGLLRVPFQSCVFLLLLKTMFSSS